MDQQSTIPQASIIVLSYNEYDQTTGPCLESLVANTYGNYELIVIDNASSDNSQEALKSFSQHHSNVRIQLNKTNRGFAGGNNDGIRLAQGKYIVLLNNDTLVPHGWLDKLLHRFNDFSNVGLIGPITNSSGNEQRIHLEGLNETNFERISGKYVQRHKGVWFPTSKLGFFCVAIHKDVIDKIGLLDEAFGLGMFEDDDYCLRAQQAGYSLAVVEDCFVYHKGSYSFKKLSESNYLELFNRNRRYYHEKHGVLWTYTDIACAVWHRLFKEFESINNLKQSSFLERIFCRVSNMNDALYQLKTVEERQALVSDHSVRDIALEQKQQQLMEISDWATSLKQDNEHLRSELSEKNGIIDKFRGSIWYKLYRRFNEKRPLQ